MRATIDGVVIRADGSAERVTIDRHDSLAEPLPAHRCRLDRARGAHAVHRDVGRRGGAGPRTAAGREQPRERALPGEPPRADRDPRPTLAADLAKAALHEMWSFNEVTLGDYQSTRWLKGKPAGQDDTGGMRLVYVDDEEHGAPAVVFGVVQAVAS